MARATRKRKAAKVRDTIARFMRPTDERIAHNDIEHAGAAVRIVPVIDTLLKSGHLTRAQYDALDYYRTQAHRAEDDCARQGTLSPEKIMGGGGSSHGGFIPVTLLATPAIIETARIERDLGSLFAIARAVAVDDMSLSRWCIQQHGGRERYDGKGRFVAMVPRREKDTTKLARFELRAAATRISR